MRNKLCAGLVELAADPDFVFMTGDLGYKALEPLREVLGSRFINAGVAEQNMVGVAAGLARSGLKPWVYSIAPFVYARPFEQIRNDACLHNLPVKLVGNGGGYGYGVMGSSHHALEDYGVLLTLQNMRVFVPAFASDIAPVLTKLQACTGPAYLRLGASEEPAGYTPPPYAPWRKLLDGGGPVMVVVGPITGSLMVGLAGLANFCRPRLWALAELPLPEFPAEFLADLRLSGHLQVVEEHVVQGSAGQMLAHRLLLDGCAPARFTHRAALGYLSGRYGSQKFHRKECGLDPVTIGLDLELSARKLLEVGN